jgi:hypothetical protein
MPRTTALNLDPGTDVFIPQPPAPGRLGDREFESRGASARASQSAKPTPRERTQLRLVGVDQSSKADSGSASTPESGIAVTPRFTYPEELNPFGETPRCTYPEELNPFDETSPPAYEDEFGYSSDDSDDDGKSVFARKTAGGIPIPGRTASRPANLAVAADTSTPLYARTNKAAHANRSSVMPSAPVAAWRNMPVHPSSGLRGGHASDDAGRVGQAAAQENIYQLVDGDGDDHGMQIRPTAPDSPIPSAPGSARPTVSNGTNANRHALPSRALPSGTACPMTAPGRAAEHPDVADALSRLSIALGSAAADAPASARKAARPGGGARLRAIMTRTPRLSSEPLYDYSMNVYKLLVSPSGTAGSKQLSTALAALTQRATDEGYDAVVKQLVERTLGPRVHSLPFETLCELGRLKDTDNKTRQAVLSRTADLLGANKRRQTRKVEQAVKQLDVASSLLSAIGELCHEHARAMSWDRQISIALEAARKGQYEQLDAALREMWSGDLLMGEVEQARVSRLMDAVKRLGATQREELAAMLGVTDKSNEPSRIFDQFKHGYLPRFETDEAIRGQLDKFIEHLRVATRAVLRQDMAGGLGVSPAQPGAASGFESADYPSAVRPRKAIRTTFSRFGDWMAASFRRRPTAHDAVKRHVKQAVQTLIEGGRLTREQIDALRAVNERSESKLGHARSDSMLHILVHDRLSKLEPGQLASLAVNLAEANREVSSLGQELQIVRPLYEKLGNALARESGIRRGAAALTRVMNALPRTRHPEELLDALNSLADAQCHALDQQSELDFYEDALRRLGSPAQKALNKRLNGRDGILRYARNIDSLLRPAPSAWSHYRWHQLDTLARAVRV